VIRDTQLVQVKTAEQSKKEARRKRLSLVVEK
jgi:hypothetical protein